jgi:hypothetical protein
MGPDKLSSLVTTLSNNTSLLWGGLVEGEWGSPGWWSCWTIAGSQDFNPRAGVQFQLSRDFMDGCHTWDPRGHTYDVLVRFFPYRVHTDSNHRGTLGYEWLLAHFCHLVVCLDVLPIWFRVLWLWLSWLCFNNVVNYLVDACFMHVIVYRCKSNTWLH